MRSSVLFALILAFPGICNAATSTWQAFDFKNCVSWSMTPDDFVRQGDAYFQAENIANELNKKGPSVDWDVIQANGDDGPLYGICGSSADRTGNSWFCKATPGFPLSGATYVNLNSMVSKCISGCGNGVPAYVYSQPYEDGEDSKQRISAERRFEKLCRKNRVPAR
jgi:hypothetical protein